MKSIETDSSPPEAAATTTATMGCLGAVWAFIKAVFRYGGEDEDDGSTLVDSSSDLSGKSLPIPPFAVLC